MNVPFLDLEKRYQKIMPEVESEIHKIFESCSFIGGSCVSNFEKNIASFLNVKYAIGCSNGTDALVLGLRACGIKPGDEVITTPFTFFATAESIASVGAVPVFVDIKQSDYNIDPAKIENAITERTKAILPVHIFGAPCDMDSIKTTANKYNLKIIEDDAQAIGSAYKGKNAGTLGDVGCFSFYPTKNLGGAGDGGMVTTDNDKLGSVLKALKEHGSGKNGAKAYEYVTGDKDELNLNENETKLYNPYKYFNYLIGYNSRLDAMQAAILSIKLKHLHEYNSNRARIAKMYMEGLTDRLIVPQYSSDIKPCWHQFAVLSEHKEELCMFLTEHGIGNGTFYPVPLHKQKAFNASNSKIPDDGLPVAEEVSRKSVCLPIFPEMEDIQIEYVIDTVNNFYKNR